MCSSHACAAVSGHPPALLTGHLVLSTLHTNNASESVTRLLDMGMDPMTFGDSLIGIVAQRLVRALCGQCAAATPLAEADFEALLTEYILDSPSTWPKATSGCWQRAVWRRRPP
ncbi:MAG: Flp pilus assembly complex ATPase component TadA [Burkholderiaceae bacterium]|nr:Flp pilus assembly complex ATPase component TadA [Burkholderiaceae bacterium]